MRLYLTLLLLTGSLALSAQSTDSLWSAIQALKKDQEVAKRLKINGWIQAQYQHADTAGAANYDGGNFPSTADSRFMLRRGRIKFTYTNGLVQYVFQLNATERFINVADMYGKISEPWTHWLSLQVGLMNRPFGYDIQYSSQFRESPERARYTQVLTPNERDLGAEIIVEAPKDSKFKGFQCTAGFFNGTGLTIPSVNISDIDSKKDFIGRISYYTTLQSKVSYGLGFSHYNGFQRIANNTYYKEVMNDSDGSPQFIVADTSNVKYTNTYAKRVYFGAEGSISAPSLLGTTTLRGEYVWGQQPAAAADSKSPQQPTTGNTYLRPFTGYYAYFIQRIMKSRHEVVLKAELYDPNTKTGGNKLDPGKGFNAGDVKYTALGVGYNFLLNDNCKFMFYYNMVRNETSDKLKGFSRDLPDNIFTARLQVRF